MASLSPWEEIDDKFCLCSICLEQLKEPKLLSCLHRFCKNCLDKLIQASSDIFKCPECREEILVPPKGVDAFKTDFYMKNLVEYVQIQKSIRSDEVRECYGCSKCITVAAYCFKCSDFLCKDCHHFHVTNKMMKDHQQHTLSLSDMESRNITVQQLLSMRDSPRCNTHPGKVSELLCATCNNLPVCLACTYGAHKGHNLNEVTELAKIRRCKLSEELKTLEKMRSEKTFGKAVDFKNELLDNLSIQKQKLQEMYEKAMEETKIKIGEIKEKLANTTTEEENTKKQTLAPVREEMEKEIEKVRTKYQAIFEVKEKEVRDRFSSQRTILEIELKRWCHKIERFAKDRNKLLDAMEKQYNQNVKTIQKISDQFDNMQKRFESLTSMASSILASQNEWSVVQCSPDMCTAAKNLMEDLKKDFPELASLVDVTVQYQQSFLVKLNVPKISNKCEKKINFDDKYQYADSMTCSSDGKIVISGTPDPSSREAFIIVIDMNGKVTKHKKLEAGVSCPYLFCDSLPSHKVVSVCQPNDIILYNILDDSYIRKTIPVLINSWPTGRYVSCVATDPVKNHILVGGQKSRDVYVFDDQLKYLHTLKFPEPIKSSRDINVISGVDQLLVCDFEGMTSYVATVDGTKIKGITEFIKPDLGEGAWRPWRVCTDKKGFVYMLWGNDSPRRCYLVQYTQDGKQQKVTRKMDDEAYALAAVETSQGEKLLVLTQRTQTVYVYGLLDDV